MHSKLLFFILFTLALPLSHAGEATSTADDDALEKRVMAVSGELRCLVCQNQTIADSHADLAIDLKNQVREKLRQGMSEPEIVDYMVKRYGDFVLYRPLVKSTTWLLWFGPFVLLVLAFGVLAVKLRQRRKAMRQAPVLSADDRARVAALLSESNGHGNYTAPDNETRHARFPLPSPLPEGEGDKVSLREFHVNKGAQS